MVVSGTAALELRDGLAGPRRTSDGTFVARRGDFSAWQWKSLTRPFLRNWLFGPRVANSTL
jgi:hypothetical protein